MHPTVNLPCVRVCTRMHSIVSNVKQKWIWEGDYEDSCHGWKLNLEFSLSRSHPALALSVMARKSSLFHRSERFVALEEVLKWLEEVLKWLEEVLNLPPNFSPSA